MLLSLRRLVGKRPAAPWASWRPADQPLGDASRSIQAFAGRYHATKPVTDHLTQNRALVPLPSLPYAFANLVVISARDFIDNPISIPRVDHRFAGIFLREARRAFRGHFQ